jgi:hypothetical protein
MGWVVSVTPRPHFSPGERTPSTPDTHCTGGWVDPRSGLDTEVRGKILSPLPGIEPWSPGRPARSQTLYWLGYPAHHLLWLTLWNDGLFQIILPNIVVEWLTFLLRIREVSGSNLGPQTGYPNYGFRGFSSLSKRILGWYLQIWPQPLPSKSFPIHHALVILSFDTIYQEWPQRGSRTACGLPLDPRVAGSNPAEAMDF